MTDKLGIEAFMRRSAVLAGLALLCILGGREAAFAQVTANTRANANFPGTHTFSPGDLLRVRIWGWPEQRDQVDGVFPVEADGATYLPVIGRLVVAGRQAEDVQQEYRKRFEVEQRNPVVTVTAVFAVSVVGEVMSPGVVDVFPGYSAFDAISLAGGFTEKAKRNTFMIVRKGSSKSFSAGNEAEGAALMATTLLESGDRIVILRSKSASLPMITIGIQALLGIATLIAVAK
ncbi:MAG TPA: polysaccharide biosynthesis/export family protein [Longimicrobiales bacterium]|nr:polysaccharide biosynthesis/export family protein [Longimicrobiales bacterium]